MLQGQRPVPTPLAPPRRPYCSQVLRALREAAGITQAGWAAWLGVGRNTVQRWESGEAVPDVHGEQALLAACRERGLFRRYDPGPLMGLDLTAEWLAAGGGRDDDWPRRRQHPGHCRRRHLPPPC